MSVNACVSGWVLVRLVCLRRQKRTKANIFPLAFQRPQKVKTIDSAVQIIIKKLHIIERTPLITVVFDIGGAP